MKHRCPIHNRPLRWHKIYKRWYCPLKWAGGHHSQDFMGLPPPKPTSKPQRKVLKDGRIILSGAAYSALKAKVLEKQENFCVAETGELTTVDWDEAGPVRIPLLCGRYITPATSELHHKRGRGM